MHLNLALLRFILLWVFNKTDVNHVFSVIKHVFFMPRFVSLLIRRCMVTKAVIYVYLLTIDYYFLAKTKMLQLPLGPKGNNVLPGEAKPFIYPLANLKTFWILRRIVGAQNSKNLAIKML